MSFFDFPFTRKDLRDALTLFAVCLAIAIAWYFAWVKPNDAFLHSVMDCMGSDHSRDAYDVCVTLLKR